MENVYEQFFYLKYSGGWSFSEAYNLPIGLREWFVERLSQQIRMENEAMKGGNQGASPGSNTQTLNAFNAPQAPPGFDSPNKG
jgi:hypothetical protein